MGNARTVINVQQTFIRGPMVRIMAKARPHASLFAAQQMALLTALADMAGRSTRVQADLAAAMRHAKLFLPVERLAAALVALEQSGYLEQIVPLGDGGTLVSVTPAGNEMVRAARRQDAFDRLIADVPS